MVTLGIKGGLTTVLISDSCPCLNPTLSSPCGSKGHRGVGSPRGSHEENG